ncbi:CHASE domain-containing protein [Noviherbaspirillum pedocola]|uniref:histidine kinase n=1 Tax=Noviherbaspirillum pedocola TaxID=2801341 RepID=A0A934W064_9BURK|nr:CHASE domain-containing protein [Noviherbaspirillum pedocola]MBK4733766.1 CHASE domain-containing protein [Noviherbaspirillum pedocola]
MSFSRKPFTGRHGPVLLAIAMLIITLGLTAVLSRNAQHVVERNVRADFDFRVRETAERIQQRMDTYQQVLRGMRGFLQGSVTPQRAIFHDYVQSLGLEQHYPGIQGLGISELVMPDRLAAHVAAIQAQGFPDYAVHPSGPREIYTAVRELEPFSPMNQRAFGYDMYSNPVRRAAMERARDSGSVALTGKVTLVQENGYGTQPGFLMYLPIYRKDMPAGSAAERRAALIGWTYAAFRSYDFMRGLGGERSADLDIRIYDGQSVSNAACLYGCAGDQSTPWDDGMLRAQRHIETAGHPWLLDIRATPSLRERMASDTPGIIRDAGIVTSLLLAALVWTLASSRSRAMALAMNMTRELRDSEFRWKFALEGAGDGLWDWDYRTGEIFYSRRWKEMLGYADNELSNRVGDVLGMLHPDDRDQTLAAITDHLEGRTPAYIAEYRMRCKDDSWKWLLARGMAVSRDEDGKPLRIIGTHTDIDSRKEAERREAERRQALEDTRKALFHAQKLEAVGQLTGGVAHDFNNVLQIITGNLDMLARDARLDDTQRTQLLSALAATERGSRLSSQLLAFARKQPLQPMVIHLGRLLVNIDALLRRALGGGIRLTTVVDDALWNTQVDPWQLENVILNLAINARDAMEEGGSLTIRLANATLNAAHVATHPDLPPGDYVTLTMADTGTGMPPEIIEQAFEPFFTTKPEGKGTGLGLSMAYGFVRQSGGHIDIDSAVGRGTTVSIYLPRSLEAQQDLPTHDADADTAAPLPGGSETVLAVEDDAGVRDIVVATLSMLGYRVLHATDADRALMILEHEPHVDLLFTDVVMPGSMRGPELAQRARERHPGIVVLFTSGYTRNAMVRDGKLEADVELLSKPYRRDQLARRVRQLLDRRADRVATAFEVARQGSAQHILVVEDDPDLRQMSVQLLTMIGQHPSCAEDAETALEMLRHQEFDWLFTDINLPGMDGIALSRQARDLRPDIRVVFASGYGDTVDMRGERAIMLKKPYDLAQLQRVFEG